MSIRAERIKSLIEEYGKSYQELERITGIKKSSLQRYASGVTAKIPLDVIEKLSKTFNVDIDYLLGKTNVRRKRSVLGAKIDQNVAHNIQYHREESNLSQKQFADLLGVDEKTVGDLENGQKKLDKEMLYKICDVLMLIPGNIIPRDDEEFSEDEEYLYSRRQNFPVQLKLTEDEQTLLELFRQIPTDQRQLVLQMIRAAIGHI